MFILCIASGEPPMCMSCSVLFAAKKAAEAARKEIDNKDSFVLCESKYVVCQCIVYGLVSTWPTMLLTS